MTKGEMLGKMLVLATNAHSNQFDKGGRPYILHPLKVMHYLKTEDEELQCIALGHDLIEDTTITTEALKEAGMSPRVIRGICDLTKSPEMTYEDYKNNLFSNIDAMKVKMCDLRHNSDIRRIKGATQKDFERIQRYNALYLELVIKLKGI